MTSRPISGERFLVALGFLKISEKERLIIEDKLWKVCDVIKKWEEETIEKNKKNINNENENGIKDERNECENESGGGDEKQNERNKAEETEGGHLKIGIVPEKNNDNSGEGDREVEVEVEEEEKGFGSYWPFQLSQIECDRATAYLSAINNSHIITQLISNLKILKLAEERGLQILDSNLISEIENIEIPLHDDGDDGDDSDDSDDGDGYSSHDHRDVIGDPNLPLTRSPEQVEVESGSSSVHGHSIVLFEGENTEEEIKREGKKKNGVGEKRTEMKEENREGENSYSDGNDEDDDDGDFYDFDDYGGYCQDTRLNSKKRKNRRRTACNKKRRMKKKIRHAEADCQEIGAEIHYEMIEEAEGERGVEGNMRRRVSFNFNMDLEHEVQVPDPAQPRSHPQMSTGDLCNKDTVNNSGDDGDGFKSNTSKIDPSSSSSISSCFTIEKQNTSLSLLLSEPNSEKLNGHSSPNHSQSHPAAHRTYIRDIVHADERKKSIRVHEYYKLWRIYDLDVVY